MQVSNKIKYALISVANKDGLIELASELVKYCIKIIASDGTHDYLRKHNIESMSVSDYTKFPEILDGRVKTLNPLIFAGILARRSDQTHLKEMNEVGAMQIDLVIIDLYHFEEKPSVDRIDIGGSALLRACSKNFEYTCTIVDNKNYSSLSRELLQNDGATSLDFRKQMATKAFRFSSYYDNMIANWMMFGESNCNFDNSIGNEYIPMRYGENPGQRGFFTSSYMRDQIGFNQLNGKELSYNNILDADAALGLVNEFKLAGIVIVKHNNPCCAAMSEDGLVTAYKNAIEADRESSFGGIVACNRELDFDTASEIVKIFTELIIAPSISEDALILLKTKPNLRVLTFNDIALLTNKFDIKSVLGGLLIQEKDYDLNFDNWRIMTDSKLEDEPELMNQARFAYTISKYVKSNAIIFTSGYTALAIGPGQTSRVGSARIASWRLKSRKDIDCLESSKSKLIMASDGFLPFSDSLDIAIENNIKILVQPGGSIRDEEVIARANECGITMIFTGQRVFRH